MNISDIDQLQKQIEEEYNDNCSKIDELKNKIWLLQRNSFEMKFQLAGILSMIPWMLGTVLLGQPILKSGLIPLELTKPLFVSVPALLGTVASTIIDKKQKIDERVKKFSSSTTKKEKIEEETRYKIEQEKLRSYNKILKNNYDDLDKEKQLISSLSSKYNITSKENDTREKEEIEENVENIKKLLEEKTNDVDIATTKHTLSNLFWNIRSKSGKFTDALMFGSIGMIICMMLYNMPMFFANAMGSIQFQTSMLGVFAPAIVGGIACTGYGIKKIHDRLCAFKNINSELGENAIPKSYDREKEENLEKLKNKTINNACAIRMQLDKEMQYLKSLDNNQKDNKEDCKTTKVESKSVEEVRKCDSEEEYKEKSDEVMQMQPLNEESEVILKKTLTNKSN